jgi:hypothetical protein
MLARRHFEVCVCAALAAALKAGDVAVEGSDAYADYRQQLLPWSRGGRRTRITLLPDASHAQLHEFLAAESGKQQVDR